ncbi:hypothetical protein MKW98_006923 [Papaver atlanticum]|uniref:Nucleoporin NDC1 n=1 Tax=Papaver atlanticum TaxID=357466 RepID=A0AAD4SW54_9MAGN|nr:hypothetical protein MKW98_006923 [Papaver atlanticum]
MSFPPSEIIKNRFLGFLIWQSISSTIIFFLCKICLLSFFSPNPFSLSLYSIIAFVIFQISLLCFSSSLYYLSSPQPKQPASFPELALSLGRFLLNSVVGGGSSDLFTPNVRNRVNTTLGFMIFVLFSGLWGSLSVVSLCRNSYSFDEQRLVGLGFRGFLFGLIYGLHYVYNKRWVLVFPIIQRTSLFSFKMGVPSAIKEAVKLSSVSFLCSVLLVVLLPHYFNNQNNIGRFIAEQIIFYIGSSAVSLCWELSHHLHQVFHTKRCTFAPSKGSAAAETNPSEPLLAALEESTPRSLLQYLAYLDLCMVCDSNVDLWRRAAFFEESGETYKRVIAVCLRPVEDLTSKLADGLEGSSVDKSDQISHQLRSPTDTRSDAKLHQAFNDFQFYVWCVRTAASLTARSHKDDRFGVAQLAGCNASVVSTLLSCLLAVEACMGKKTNLQAPHLMGAANIKWAPLHNSGRREGPTATTGKKRGGPLHAKAYAMADVLRTSLYIIVSEFHSEMIGSAKTGILEKDWIVTSKPLYSTRDILVQKLGLFLEYRAC